MSESEKTAAKDLKEDAANEQEILEEVRQAYERARTDLKETTDRLRTELKNIDVEQVGESAKNWVKENPGLAFFLAVGAGMLAGRAITKALEPPPPPSFRERARQSTSRWADSARHLADDTQDRLARQAMDAGAQVADRVKSVRGTLHDRTSNLTDVLQQRTNDLSSIATEKAGDLIASFSDAAERAADSLQYAARDLSKSIKKKKKTQLGLWESLAQASKTVFGAFVFKRLTDWIRERY